MRASYDVLFEFTETQEFMVPALSSVVVPEVAIMTTAGASSDEKVGIMQFFGFKLFFYLCHSPVFFGDIALC